MAFEVGGTTPAAASAAAYATLNTGANRRGKIRELGWTTTAATASSVGLGVPANTPVASTTITPLAQDSQDATGSVLLGTAWSTAPTAPTTFFRKLTVGAAIGAGIAWPWPSDARLTMQKSTWLTLWNYGGAAGSALDVYVQLSEE